MYKVVAYLHEVREVFKSITWPKRDTLIQLTVVVISLSIIISLVLGGFDYAFTNSIGFIGNLKNTATTPTSVAIPTISIATPSANLTPQTSPKVTLKPTKSK